MFVPERGLNLLYHANLGATVTVIVSFLSFLREIHFWDNL